MSITYSSIQDVAIYVNIVVASFFAGPAFLIGTFGSRWEHIMTNVIAVAVCWIFATSIATSMYVAARIAGVQMVADRSAWQFVRSMNVITGTILGMQLLVVEYMRYVRVQH